MQGNL